MLYLVPGMRVKVDPPFNEEPFAALVVDVRDRYGLINHGQARRKPVVTVRDDHGEERHIDASFVKEITVRTPNPPSLPFNIYREQRARYGHLLHGGRRNEWAATVVMLVEHVVGGLQIAYPFGVNPKKVSQMFERDHPGFICDCGHGIVRVHRKAFEKWVKRNATRFSRTRREVDEFWTALHHEDDLLMDEDLLYFEEKWSQATHEREPVL